MKNPDIEKFIDLIEKDIRKLKEYISQNTLLLSIQKSEFDILNFNLLIKFDYFKEIVEKECYQLRSPVFPTADADLSERLQLFNKVFLSKLGEITHFTIHRHWSTIGISDFEQSLFMNLLYAVLRKHLITENDIKDILLNYLDIWHDSIKSEKAPINILIQMPNVDPVKDMELIKEKLYVKATRSFTVLSKKTSITVHNALLIYRTQLSFKIYISVEEHNSNVLHYNEIFENEWKVLKEEIQDIVFSFYLNHVDFDFKDFIEGLPWWFDFDHEKFLKKIKSFKTRVSFLENTGKSIAELYPKIIKSNLFRDENFITASHHYMQLHNRDFFPDIILDSFILLEFLFSKETKENITFQMSFNTGLFLANTTDEFLVIFKFIKGTYGIRSALVHGDKWPDKLEKFISKSPIINDKFELITELKRLISSSFKKLILLMESNPLIFTDINQLTIQNNKIRKAEDLMKLGTEYKTNKIYAEALKMYVEALKIYEELKNEIMIEEILEKVKVIYDKSKNIIVYSDELKRFTEELELIIRVKGERKEDVEELLETIYDFKNIITKNNGEKLGSDIDLAIDGNDIMKILKIEPSEEVGEIKMLLIHKVLNGELKNQKEDLLSFIRSLK